jgi:hypothetical protein
MWFDLALRPAAHGVVYFIFYFYFIFVSGGIGVRTVTGNNPMYSFSNVLSVVT